MASFSVCASRTSMSTRCLIFLSPAGAFSPLLEDDSVLYTDAILFWCRWGAERVVGGCIACQKKLYAKISRPDANVGTDHGTRPHTEQLQSDMSGQSRAFPPFSKPTSTVGAALGRER